MSASVRGGRRAVRVSISWAKSAKSLSVVFAEDAVVAEEKESPLVIMVVCETVASFVMENAVGCRSAPMADDDANPSTPSTNRKTTQASTVARSRPGD